MTNPLWIALAAAVVSLLLLFAKDFIRNRKAIRAGDYAVETQRIVNVPEHCVNCLSAHATVPIRVMPHVPPGYGPIVPLIDPRFRTRFTFRYCDRCAASIRSRRLVGTVLLTIAFAIVGVTLLAELILVFFFPKGHRAPDVLWLIAYAGLASGMLIGLPASIAGQQLHRYAPGVSIVNGGGPTIVFHFTSRVYRDHFAEMNERIDEAS